MFFNPLNGAWISKKGDIFGSKLHEFRKKGVFIVGKLQGLIKGREEVELQGVFYSPSV